MNYTLPKLPFSYNALEPFIDVETMHVHHDGHHKAYVEKLNKALEPYPKYQKPVEELLVMLDQLPEEIRTEVKNNGGGHANHSLFWTVLSPEPQKIKVESLAKALDDNFDSFANFKKKFTEVAVKHFSNGWAWLAADKHGKLSVFSTKDHESPITQGLTPLLVLDLWEHAYYLQYENRRPEFVSAFWNIVNWEEVGKRWTEFEEKGSTNREWKRAS